jgi:hypothetical protein
MDLSVASARVLCSLACVGEMDDVDVDLNSSLEEARADMRRASLPSTVFTHPLSGSDGSFHAFFSIH